MGRIWLAGALLVVGLGAALAPARARDDDPPKDPAPPAPDPFEVALAELTDAAGRNLAAKATRPAAVDPGSIRNMTARHVDLRPVGRSIAAAAAGGSGPNARLVGRLVELSVAAGERRGADLILSVSLVADDGELIASTQEIRSVPLRDDDDDSWIESLTAADLARLVDPIAKRLTAETGPLGDGARPVLAVTQPRNKTSEHIDVSPIVDRLEGRLAEVARVHVVDRGDPRPAPDLVLLGSLSGVVRRVEEATTRRYTLAVRLVDLRTGLIPFVDEASVGRPRGAETGGFAAALDGLVDRLLRDAVEGLGGDAPRRLVITRDAIRNATSDHIDLTRVADRIAAGLTRAGTHRLVAGDAERGLLARAGLPAPTVTPAAEERLAGTLEATRERSAAGTAVNRLVLRLRIESPDGRLVRWSGERRTTLED